jgi:hypothetical protein
MSLVDDCTKFLEDLIMGDFNEDQMVSAQIVGGLISLVPVVDQVMDVRDVSGSLYRINKQGGFAKATIDQKIYLGFAAFGVVPEVGSAFKTVFKPLYKERKALKGAVNSGVAMIERMLSKSKGGALAWVKALNWAGNTQAAILQANMALESCIALLDYVAQGHWWCPDHLEQLARDVSPGIKKMRGQLAGPIREASGYIKAFITELLGEHAAAVVMTVASNAGSIPHSGQHGAKARSGDSNTHLRVADKPRLNGRTTTGKIASVVQRTAFEAYKGLTYSAKGLMGEHIVDHHVIEQKGWGLEWNRHDMIGGPGKKASGWQSEFRKLNDDEIPLYLCTPSVHVLTHGIDSLWLTNRTRPHQFAVVEAKASMSLAPKLLSLLGEAKGASDAPAPATGRKRKNSSGAVRTGPSTTLKSGMVMQMSRTWISDRIQKDFPRYRILVLKNGRNYSRHVILVSPIQAGEHLKVLEKIISEGLISKSAAAQKYAAEHSRHDIQREFGESDLDAAEAEYKIGGRPPLSGPGKKRKK